MSDAPPPPPIPGSRVLCIHVPLFPLAARLRCEPDLREEALVVVAGRGQAARVVAATRRARQAGIRAGFTLTQARARLPRLVARTRDPESERAAQEALLDVAESFSPRVEDAGEGLAYLDATGLHRIYPGDDTEGDLGRAVIRAMEQRALMPARVGVAASKLAAAIAAQSARSPQVVAAGQESAYLAPMPLERISGQAGALATLRQWGIGSLGDLARLPVAEVISRLGPAGAELYAVARGEDPRPLVPRSPPHTFTEGLEFEWPLVQVEPLLFVARAALERLMQRLAGRALGCLKLEYALHLESHGRHERALILPAPTRELKTLLTLLRLDLEAHPPDGPIAGLTLVAHPERPRAAQLSLFGPAALAPDQLATTLARLFALLGEDRVGSPQVVNAHRPEAHALRPYAPPAPPLTRGTLQPRPSAATVRVLRPPVPVEVITDGKALPTPPVSPPPAVSSATETPADTAEPALPALAPIALERPLSIRSLAQDTPGKPTIHGVVKVASGPWCLEEEWWNVHAIARDYWDIELANGILYRLYRERASGDWFIDGVYD
jgi:protein ImuB